MGPIRKLKRGPTAIAGDSGCRVGAGWAIQRAHIDANVIEVGLLVVQFAPVGQGFFQGDDAAL